MPGMDGFMLLKKLQEEVITQSVPVILITSLSDTRNEYKGLMLGAVDYISKPFHPLIVKASQYAYQALQISEAGGVSVQDRPVDRNREQTAA